MNRSLACLLVFSAPGCAYYAQQDGERLSNEVYALQTQVTAMQQALTQLADDHKKTQDTVSGIGREVADL